MPLSKEFYANLWNLWITKNFDEIEKLYKKNHNKYILKWVNTRVGLNLTTVDASYLRTIKTFSPYKPKVYKDETAFLTYKDCIDYLMFPNINQSNLKPEIIKMKTALLKLKSTDKNKIIAYVNLFNNDETRLKKLLDIINC